MRLVTARDRDGVAFPGVLAETGITNLAPLGFADMSAAIRAGRHSIEAALTAAEAPIGHAELLVPLIPAMVMGTGTNYRSHVLEMGGTEPPRPTANFVKLPSSVCGPDATVEIPAGQRLDYEGEIAIIIGSEVSGADPGQALDALFGLCLANDLSARDSPTTHLTLAKSGVGFCPLGPWITTTDELDLDEVSFEVFVNDELRQRGHAGDLIHSILDVIVSFSESLPLSPGDVILTGSPSGVGVALNPPRFLEHGDTVEIRSDQLGTLTNTFITAASVDRT